MTGSLYNFKQKTPMLCLQMQGLHPTEVSVNVCQSREVFFSSDTFTLKSHDCSKKTTKILLLEREGREDGMKTRASYSFLLILVRNKSPVLCLIRGINNVTFWPPPKQTICLHWSHRRSCEQT